MAESVRRETRAAEDIRKGPDAASKRSKLPVDGKDTSNVRRRDPSVSAPGKKQAP